MKSTPISVLYALPLLTAASLATACGSGDGGDFGASVPGDEASELELGQAEQAIAACAGDDPNYDYNALAAELAVAVANELGRWDATADFELRYGKLELSATGQMRCNGGCPNVTTLLRMQDDSTANVPGHSPSIYRQKLSSWYQKQKSVLTSLVDRMLTVDKGIYRFKARHSGKYMAVDAGSTWDGAIVEQQTALTSGADQWRLMLQGTKHKFVNVRSGKCLELSSDSANDFTTLVQRTCSSFATTQGFEFAYTGGGHYAIRTKWLKALDVNGGSLSNDARVVQYGWSGSALNQQWALEPVGTGQHIDPAIIATAVYRIGMKHSGKAIGVDAGSLLDGAVIEQGTYVSTDDRFHWYITQVGSSYQFINRRSGKCMALTSDSASAGLAQMTCSTSASQLFSFTPSGDGHQAIYSNHGKTLEIAGASIYNDARLSQAADGIWADHRLVALTPVISGEPHRLVFSHTTGDAPCGDAYFWYDIAQPNLAPLRAPADSFVQLIFAGGKETLTGTDINPFISQQVSGDLVAIDPTYGLIDSGSTTSGACTAACVKSSSINITGQCCSCNGVSKQFAKSTWNASTYLCQ
jgi:hypothetical protein